MQQETREDKSTYLVPGKVTTRTEIFPGIGWSEVAFIGIALAIGFMIFGLLSIPQTQIHEQTINIAGEAVGEQVKTVAAIPLPLRMVVLLGIGGGAFVLVRKDNGVSILGMIARTVQFSQSKKRYYFRSRGI